MTSTARIRYSVINGGRNSRSIAYIELARPEARNALDLDTALELRQALLRAETAPSVGVAVLRGEGPAFCAGGDLKYILKAFAEDRKHDVAVLCRTVADVISTIEGMSTIVASAVRGPAWAGGLALCLASDLVVADTTATFGVPEARIGLADPYIGLERARWMMFTGSPVDAALARDWGMAIDVVEPDALDDATLRLATRICEGSASSLGNYKRMTNATLPSYDMSTYMAALLDPDVPAALNGAGWHLGANT